ncbi:MAG: hypothetical protein M3336_06335 [Chloroflexota bacterium]|nr:hypothetical protein [Chloroflexota bacterium]
MTGLRGSRPPPGYVRLLVGHTHVVAPARLIPTLREALRDGSLYDYATHHPQARPLTGRGIAYAVPLPDGCTNVVVRRSRHGGLLAPMTGDRFLGATRAPRELKAALRLAALGVPTPEVLAYATYPAGSWFRRADVLTREVPNASDLAAALVEATEESAKRELLQATAELLARLTAAGARHPDLNIKNVLIARDTDSDPEGFVLDVDRVWFDIPGNPRVTAANLRRFSRSARKAHRVLGTPIGEEDLQWLAGAVAELSA